MPAGLLAVLAKLFEVKHFSDGHTPTRQQPLVEHNVWIRMRTSDWRPLKAWHISCHRSELVLPNPSQDFFRGFDASEGWFGALRDRFLLGGTELVICNSETAPDKQNISWPEFDFLLFDNCLEMFKKYGDGLNGLELDIVAASPFGVI